MKQKIKNYIEWKFRICLKGGKEIISDVWLNSLGAAYFVPIGLRRLIYNVAGNNIKKKCRIHPKCFLGPGKGRLIIGGVLL